MRIIGIRLFETKWHTINKVLKPGWYPFGCYDEPQEGTAYCLPHRSETVATLYDLNDKNPHIEVSCLVGKNGSGKSTLLDILYRIINNYSVTVLGEKMDNAHGRHLQYADGLNADLYYELESNLYKICCRDKDVHLFVQDENAVFESKEIVKGDFSGFDHFFYTISNNYSLYSLNEIEYKEIINAEKEGKEEETINGNWVDGLFHKNDGYLAPIVITPYRERGSVDIEKENGLALQRIAAISVLGAATKEPSILDGYHVKSIQYKINRSYESKIEAKFRTDWEKRLDKEFFDCILKGFEKEWSSKLGTCLDLFNEQRDGVFTLDKTKRELILLYLSYKTFKICMTYDDYYNLFKINEILCFYDRAKSFVQRPFDIWADLHKQDFAAVVERLCDPRYDSHINLKIRQCINYVNNNVYTEDDDKIDIEALIKEKEVKTFDDAVLLLPPPFYDIDLVLERDEKEVSPKEKKEITISTLSSGERQMLCTMSYVLYHVKNIQSVKPSDNCHLYHHINLIFDEAELYYHPDFQKQFVMKLIDYIAKCNLNKDIIKSINVIIATHSPFVLTDILTQNTLYLSDGVPNTVERQTFGANYYDMLHDSFFFEDTALGGVATRRIKEWLSGKNEKGDKVDVAEVTGLVGDPLICNYLTSGIYVQD